MGRAGDALQAVLQIACGGAVLQLILYFLRRRGEVKKLDADVQKTDAESTNLLGEAADRLIGRLEADVERTRREMDELRSALAERDRTIEQLSERVTALNTQSVLDRARISELETALSRRTTGS